MSDAIRLVLVDDDALVRAGLRLMLRRPGIEIVGECDDGSGAAAMVVKERADVVLMDIRMPGMDGITATQAVLRARPATRVVVLTTFDADELVVAALRAGAHGFLLKDSPPERIEAAVRGVVQGEPGLSPAIASLLMAKAAGTTGAHDVAADARARLASLTARELDVARALGDGLSNAEIAADLHLSVPTIKAHVSSILAKLGAENRVQIAIVVHDAG